MWADAGQPQEGWKKLQFGDLAVNVTERVDEPSAGPVSRYVGLEHLDSNRLDIRRWGSSDEVEATKLRFRAGDLIFGRRRAYQRKLAIATFEGICSAHALVLRPNQQEVTLNFLAHLMRTDAFYQRALAISVGSLSPTINWRTLTRQELYVPSLSEQRRIGDLLDAAYDQVRKLDGTIEAALGVRKVLLRDFFTNWSGEGRIVSSIGEHFFCRSGATPKRSENRYFEDGTIPWVKTQDLSEGDVLETDEYITEAALKETSCRLMPPETVLVAMYGGFRQIGRTGILRDAAATNQAVCCIAQRDGSVLPEYLLYSLQANRRHWRRVAASSRKDPNITKRDVEEFPLSLPSRLDEQHNLVSKVKTFDRFIESLRSLRDAAEELEKALGNSYVSGSSQIVH